MTEALLPLMADIRKAATSVASRWPDVITAEDLEHDLIVRLIEDKYVHAITKMDTAARSAVLGRIAVHIAARTRDDYEVFTGNYHYGTSDVRRILDSGVLRGRRMEDADVERLDLLAGLTELIAVNPEGVYLILAVYFHNEAAGDSSRRKKLQRAVDTLTRYMNRSHTSRATAHEEGPGSRQVLTNAQAQAISGRSY